MCHFLHVLPQIRTLELADDEGSIDELRIMMAGFIYQKRTASLSEAIHVSEGRTVRKLNISHAICRQDLDEVF